MLALERLHLRSLHSSSSVTLILGLEVQGGEGVVMLVKPANLMGTHWEGASLRGFPKERQAQEVRGVDSLGLPAGHSVSSPLKWGCSPRWTVRRGNEILFIHGSVFKRQHAESVQA